ncbi:MAG: PKD domain-containing protein [Planctomycetota bacterium]
MKRTWKGIGLGIVLALSLSAAQGATFYVDPVNGSMAGDGSAGDPWSTLAEVISNNKIESMKPASYPYAYGDPLVVRNDGAPVQPGDTLELLSGDHGEVYAQGYFNPDWITVRAAAGHTPVVRRFQFRGGCKWRIDGVTISQEPYGTPGTITAVNFENHGWHGPTYDCILENSHVYGVDDTSTYTANDWLTTTPGSGVSSGGPRNIIRYNTIRNIQLGVNVNGADSVVEYNVLCGMAHDGFRSGNDRIVWQYNHLSDFVDVDGNHDDIIQLYRGGGVPHDSVEIRGNTFDGRKIPGRPLTTSPQGVGCFDGPYVDCVVENNVVLTAHYHGISLYEADGCTIINNTVLDPSRNYPAWIRIPYSSNTVVRNNLSYSIPDPDEQNGIVVDHNIELTDTLSDQIFVDWRNGDVHLLADGPAVDTGSGTLAPSTDIEGVSRPQGDGYDIGAYEYEDLNVAPTVDAGSDDTITYPTMSVNLDGTVGDDGLPDPPAVVTTTWSTVSGPGTVVFGDAGAVDTTASFDRLGVYVLRLTADDGDLQTTDDVTITVDPAADGQMSSTTWQTFPFDEAQSGAFTVEYDAVADGDSIDGVTGICLGVADWWTDLACIFRFDVSGTCDVRNGGGYAADTTVTYEAGEVFHVRMEIDIATHTYSVYVTPYGGSEILLADTYAFRTEQASVTSLDGWAIQSTSGSHTVSGVTVTPANVPPVADAGNDQTVTDTDGDGSASVTLDGSGSSDSDGTIVSYVWKEGAVQIATGVNPAVTMDVSVHTVDLTVTDDDDATDSDSVVVTVVSRTLTSSTSPYTWPNSVLPTQTGTFTCEFDMVPNSDGMDGVTGLSSGIGDWWTDLACIVRFNTSNQIDVRDGSGYTADTTLSYTQGVTYHVRMVIDIPNNTYSVYVTPDGQSEVTLATDYAFRTEQQGITSLDHWTLNAGNSVGTHTVSSLTLTD